ncbi:MAG TPA: LamG-like jellyroll fold domain-containing protein [Polyangia bacterium]
MQARFEARTEAPTEVRIDARSLTVRGPLPAGLGIALWLAVAASAGCVRFDDSAVGNLGDAGVATERADGSDAEPGQLAPDAAPPAVVGDAGVLDSIAAPDGSGETGVPVGDGSALPEVAPVDVPAPLPDLAPVVDVTAPADVPVPAPDLAPNPLPDAAGPAPEVAGPPPVGLVVHWQFNEARGLTSADVTGRGNTATLVSGAGWAEGVEGSAVSLDGENDHVRATPPATPAIEAPKALAFFYFRGLGGNGGLRTCAALNNPNADAGIQIGIDRGRPAVWQWGQNAGFAASPRLAPPGWSHVAYTYDGTRHRLYVDGVMVDTSVQTPQSGKATNLLLGAPDVEDVDDDEMCRGRIDDFRLFDRALTDAEVAQLAKR